MKVCYSIYLPPQEIKPGTDKEYILYPNVAETVITEDWNEFVELMRSRSDKVIPSKINNCFISPGDCGDKTRAVENVVRCGLLGLDYDDGKMSPSLPLQRLSPWSVLVYSTFTSTAAFQKFRVFIPLSRFISGDEYRLLSRWLVATYFYEYKFDSASYEPSRLYFIPSRTAEAFFLYQDGIALPVDGCLERAAAFHKQQEDSRPPPRPPSSYKPLLLEEATTRLQRLDAANYEDMRMVAWTWKDYYGDVAYPIWYKWSITARSVKKRPYLTDRGLWKFWNAKQRTTGRRLTIATFIDRTKQ